MAQTATAPGEAPHVAVNKVLALAIFQEWYEMYLA